mmetsp:Transcript_1850/g.4620  ORF Transcript_1850/g.4620 Transcript_1850/m.4620 type:complete len:258 (-) Transcript_1850:500-1273(-)
MALVIPVHQGLVIRTGNASLWVIHYLTLVAEINQAPQALVRLRTVPQGIDIVRQTDMFEHVKSSHFFVKGNRTLGYDGFHFGRRIEETYLVVFVHVVFEGSARDFLVEFAHGDFFGVGLRRVAGSGDLGAAGGGHAGGGGGTAASCRAGMAHGDKGETHYHETRKGHPAVRQQRLERPSVALGEQVGKFRHVRSLRYLALPSRHDRLAEGAIDGDPRQRIALLLVTDRLQRRLHASTIEYHLGLEGDTRLFPFVRVT